MKEINYENLTVIYNNETDFSKKNIMRIKALETSIMLISAICVLICIFVGSWLNTNLVVITVAVLVIIFGVPFMLIELLNKVAPKNYDFIQCINRADNIEVGWFNSRYIALIHFEGNGWKVKELKRFINNVDYQLNDTAKKDKPIHMTIDVTKEVVEITVENKEGEHGESN
ncbi:MAG: hypothetical protein J6A59_00820 [Lachnospiraceae bacterium]|nr:hypothetical protein [Lachnospiraceae bacterium]